MDGITFYGTSDKGNKRTRNEDSLWPPAGATEHPNANHPLGQLFVVADGMGGYGAGNIASQITVETVPEVYYSESTPGATPTERLHAAITAAHEQIKIEASAAASMARMGTTIVAVVILEQQLWVAWVGDSRAYLLRKFRLQQLTEDHSVLWEQIKAGLISWEALHYHPYRSKLNNSLTAQRDEVTPSFLEAIPLQPDDQLLLCSDGLSSEVQNSRIEGLLRSYPPDECALALIDAANSPKAWLKEGESVQTAGGEDNITVIVIHMPEAGQDPAGTQSLGKTQPVPFHPGRPPAVGPDATLTDGPSLTEFIDPADAPLPEIPSNTPTDEPAVSAPPVAPAGMPAPAPQANHPTRPMPATSGPSSTGKWLGLALAGLAVVALILLGAALFIFRGIFSAASPPPTSVAASSDITPTGDVDVALGEAIPTATPAVASPTPAPTEAEATAAPLAPGETPRATSTLAASPTPIPTVTPTSTPLPTATATATATETPPPTAGELYPPGSKQLLQPVDGKVFVAGTSTIQFVWRLGDSCNVPPDMGFELRVWREGRNPEGAMDAVSQQGDVLCVDGVYSYTVGDLQSAPGVNGATEGTFLWDVRLLRIDPYEPGSPGRDTLVHSFGLGAGAEQVPTLTPFPTAPLSATATLTATGTITATP